MPLERVVVPEVFEVRTSSHAVCVEGHIHLGGCLPTVGPSLKLAEGGIAGQTRQVIANLEHALKGCGASLDDLVRATVYLADVTQFLEMDQVYGELITSRPVRTTIGAGGLSLGALVEMDALAYRSS